MIQKITNLQILRKLKEEKDDALHAIYDAFNKQNEPLNEERKALGAQIEMLESNIKKEAIAQFAIDGTMKFEGGVQIKKFKTIDYKKQDAMDWATDNARTCFVFSDTVFKKIAKANPSAVNFVTFSEEPRAQIPKELEAQNDSN